MIDIGRSENGSGKFGSKVIFFVGTASGAEHGKAGRSVFLNGIAQPPYYGSIGFIPGNRLKSPVFSPEKRLCQPVRMANKAMSLPSLGTEHAFTDRVVETGVDTCDAGFIR